MLHDALPPLVAIRFDPQRLQVSLPYTMFDGLTRRYSSYEASALPLAGVGLVVVVVVVADGDVAGAVDRDVDVAAADDGGTVGAGGRATGAASVARGGVVGLLRCRQR